MWGTIEQFAIMLAISILKLVIKNPASVAKEGTIVSEIATAATEADMAVNGTIWSSTPAPK